MREDHPLRFDEDKAYEDQLVSVLGPVPNIRYLLLKLLTSPVYLFFFAVIHLYS